MVLLAVGTVVGYGAGFASLHCRHSCARQSFEQHIADVCVAAANHVQRPAAAPPAK
ncbi:MAG: hypothetical protein ABI551_26745 [Polyangiaceae bacterium]